MRPGFAAALLLAGTPATAQVAAPAVTAPSRAPPTRTAPAAPTREPQGKPQGKPQDKPSPAGLTPNAQREVVIGAINKRTGQTRTFIGKPGQQFDFGGLRVQVRTCEKTPPWEQKLTGAFLLIDERRARGSTARVYSGWMFAESPSLHPLEHPRYDVWVKSCTMSFPETGPDTVVAARETAASRSRETAAGSPRRSSAKKSAATPSAEAN